MDKKIFDNFESSLGVLFFIGMVIATSLGVWYRYVLQHSLTWSEEVSRYSFVWLAFFSMSYAAYKEKHVRIDILTSVFYKKNKKMVLVLRLIGKTCWLLFTLFMVYQGYNLVYKSYLSQEVTAALYLPMIYVYACLSVGFMFMAYRLIKQLIKEFLIIRSTK